MAMRLSERGRTWAIATTLAGIVALLYAPVRSFDYVNLDDSEYVYENARVLAGWTRESVRWAWTAHHSGHWHPLTWLSLMLDVELFGPDPGAAHLVNVGLHAAGAVLFFLWLRAATGDVWCSAFVAAWFAVHPLRVESVAWITARKDVLSGLFLMSAMCLYVAYARRPTALRYVAVLAAFASGLLAKPTLATLPIGLLLFDIWPLRSIGPQTSVKELAVRVAEKVPLCALAAGTLAQTMQSQEAARATVSSDILPLADRIANAATSYVTYASKTLWPVDLAVFYPFQAVAPATAVVSIVLLGLVTGAAIVAAPRARGSGHEVWPRGGGASLLRRCDYRLVGWLWFCGTLVPVSGIIQFGGQSLADRYSYIPHIGLLVALSWSMARIAKQLAVPRSVQALLATAVLGGYGWIAAQQIAHWQNSFTLFERALAVTSDNFMAHNNLGVAWERAGDLERAAHHYAQAVRANPTWPDARNNYGNTFAWRGDYAQARIQYAAALERRPDFALAENNLGAAYAREGDFAAALHHFGRAVAIDPDYVDARFALASVLESFSRWDEAEEHLAKVVAAQPDSREAVMALERVRQAGRR